MAPLSCSSDTVLNPRLVLETPIASDGGTKEWGLRFGTPPSCDRMGESSDSDQGHGAKA